MILHADKVVFTPDEFVEAVNIVTPRSVIIWDDLPFWYNKREIVSDFACFWNLVEELQ